LDLALQAVECARKVDLTWLSGRMSAPPRYPDVWPGEHYKLLAGLVMAHKPKRIVEIGTFQGLSALAMKRSAPAGCELITVDIIPWNEIPDTAFLSSDFHRTGLRQIVGDLSNHEFFSTFAETLTGCDLLFVDAPKNVVFETTLLRCLATIRLPSTALVVFDDIRLWDMVGIWRGIRRPKLDLTSFGHWSGTGLIDWNGQSEMPEE
jgi:predicted O-methyltransferase YrrM